MIKHLITVKIHGLFLYLSVQFAYAKTLLKSSEVLDQQPLSRRGTLASLRTLPEANIPAITRITDRQHIGIDQSLKCVCRLLI